jgi:hypothetical protein
VKMKNRESYSSGVMMQKDSKVDCLLRIWWHVTH